MIRYLRNLVRQNKLVIGKNPVFLKREEFLVSKEKIENLFYKISCYSKTMNINMSKIEKKIFESFKKASNENKIKFYSQLSESYGNSHKSIENIKTNL